jgi:glucosamine 6-phosphate synthetase-like amidotransferase/phosphosugar isomerase protein
MAAARSKHPDTLLLEIQSQATLCQTLVSRYPASVAPFASLCDRVPVILGLAEGSSKHALEIAAPFLEQWTGKPLWIASPETLEQRRLIGSQYGRAESPLDALSPGLLLVVSQSGETASVLRMLEALAPERSGPLLALTNRERSTLSELAGNHLFLDAGEEKSIAATKTMTASILQLLLWGLAVGTHLGRLTVDQSAAILQQLQQLPQRLATLWTPAALDRIQAFTQKLIEVNHFVLLSKGPLTLVLPEVGLKLTETSSNIVYTDNTESFKHGPKVILSGVQEHHPNTVYLVPTEPGLAEGLFKDIRSHFWLPDAGPADPPAFESDRVFFIAFDNSGPLPEALGQGLALTDDRLLRLPMAPTLLEGMLMSIVTFQLISYQLARLKGESPDNPMLEKAVTG